MALIRSLMTIRLLVGVLALALVAVASPPVRAQDAGEGTLGYEGADQSFRQRIPESAPHGRRGPRGTTLSTGGYRIDPNSYRMDGPGGTGSLGALVLKDPRFRNETPACAHGPALEEIARRFAQKESQFWNSALTITTFDQMRLLANNPWGPDAVPRRYCAARVTLSDGRKRAVHYSIGEDLGMIGMDFGVEWCVVGLDRGRSFDPSCKMARP